jgi:predicted alpha-1,2-mannosidase
MKTTQSACLLLSLAVLAATSCSTYHPSASEAAAGTSGKPVLLDLVQYANPMCGTGTSPGVGAGDNNCYPGAVAPFGMIQWSPDTDAGEHRGGYYDADKTISDFSLDHLSGTGCHYGEDFAFTPILGGEPASPPDSRTAFAVPFSHANETVQPGYYAVTLDNGMKVELTTTTRSGFGRFTFPGDQPATMMINAASDANGSSASGINIDPATREISGWSVGGHFCGTRESRMIYFYGVFDQPFKSWSTWSDKMLTAGATNGTGTASGAFITFDTSSGRTVLAKVGISYVSVANAKANVEAESPLSEFTSEDFDEAVKAAVGDWNRWLNKIQVSGGTKDEKETFYSMLYHALLGPQVVSDANGEYYGYDGRVHTTEDGHAQYGVFSGWDIYRSECQLLAMLAPKQAGDMAQSLLVDYQQGGTFPRWGVMTEDSGVMMGDPAAAMIADFYDFGATNFDAEAALKGLVRAATDPSVYAPRTQTYERDALGDYLGLGYVPEHQKGSYGNVSMTLEFDSADFALSQFAQALGENNDSAMLLDHAQKWKNLFNPKTGYIQMRRRDGSWAPGFTNNVNRYDGDTAYVEGTAGQYLWMVPFDLKGLAKRLGGPAAAAKRLDAFFTKLNVGDHGPDAWMAWVGNEPNLNTPWIYDFLGQPWKTQSTMRRVMTELYSCKDDAYPGNDDVGEMSSWYIFGALGIYPELPGSDVLVFGSPMFPKAVLHLPDGDVTIIGRGAAPDAPYVQDLKVNGHSWNMPWLRYSNISHGATLAFDLGDTANTHWGGNLVDAPPSYSGGH